MQPASGLGLTAPTAMQALAFPEKMGIWQGLYSGFTVGFMNCTFLCAYALALWYGSTRVAANQYTVRLPVGVNKESFAVLSVIVAHVVMDVRVIQPPSCSSTRANQLRLRDLIMRFGFVGWASHDCLVWSSDRRYVAGASRAQLVVLPKWQSRWWTDLENPQQVCGYWLVVKLVL